jgi:hypothetical protein
VNSTLSHNAVEFADCTVEEQPPPQPGDDAFAVRFIAKDDGGFQFEVTGVTKEVDAALTFCMAFRDERCLLTDPDGNRVEGRGIEINSIRANVERIHIGVAAEELQRSGSWTLVVDLGSGRVARTTFEVE